MQSLSQSVGGPSPLAMLMPHSAPVVTLVNHLTNLYSIRFILCMFQFVLYLTCMQPLLCAESVGSIACWWFTSGRGFVGQLALVLNSTSVSDYVCHDSCRVELVDLSIYINCLWCLWSLTCGLSICINCLWCFIVMYNACDGYDRYCDIYDACDVCLCWMLFWVLLTWLCIKIGGW
jgi:hypothetical protein